MEIGGYPVKDWYAGRQARELARRASLSLSIALDLEDMVS
jgi:hypothetical protein